MVGMRLSCGCKVTAAYRGHVKWDDLPKEEQEIIADANASSRITAKCPKVQPKPSAEPQKP